MTLWRVDCVVMWEKGPRGDDDCGDVREREAGVFVRGRDCGVLGLVRSDTPADITQGTRRRRWTVVCRASLGLIGRREKKHKGKIQPGNETDGEKKSTGEKIEPVFSLTDGSG